MDYQCKLVKQDPLTVLSVRMRTAVKDLPDAIGREYGRIYAYMQEIGAQPVEAPFVGYFNMDMNDLDVEIGFPVAKEVEGKNEIQCGQIQSGTYAETLHIGSYDDLKTAYEALMQWMEENGHEAMGIGYEFYLNDPETTPEQELKTRILLAVK